MSVVAIVLAAGASSRMGRPKALLETGDGRTFARAIAETARAAGVDGVLFVVGPPHGSEVTPRLPPATRAVTNGDPARGMLSSIQIGIAALQHAVQAALVWPVDQPAVAVATVQALLAAPAGRVAMPARAGRGGHPVRIPRALFPDVLALPHERGLRGLLEDRADLVWRLEVDDKGALSDVDTPEEYRRFLAR